MSLENEKQTFLSDGVIGPFKIYDPAEAKRILHKIRRGNFDKSNAVFDNDVNYDRHLDIEELMLHIQNPKITSHLNNILGEDILCWRTEFFPKFPHSDGTEWHQVANYQYANGKPMLESTENESSEFSELTVWTAFTDTTIETACMRFIPGSHTEKHYDETKAIGTQPHEYDSNTSETNFYGYNFSEFKVDPNWQPEEQKTVSMELKAGECIIFTARCVHASHPNLSDTFTRFAISSRYVPTHVKVYPNTKKFYAHGAWFDLKKYSCVLISGVDAYGHNHIKS